MGLQDAVRFLFACTLSLGPAAAQTYTIHTVAGGGVPQDVPALSVGLGHINGIAVDGAGNLYLALNDFNAVVRIDSQGMLTLVAGGGIAGSSGDGGPAIKAQLNLPTGVAVDTAGNVYVSEHSGCRVRKISGGIITTVAGSGKNVFGASLADPDGIPATQATLEPAGLALDSAGNLYIADMGNNSIRKVSNGVISTVAGTWDISHPTEDNMPATEAVLWDPVGLAVDSAGNLYVSQHENASTVRKISNGMIATVAGTMWVPGYSGDNGPATSALLDYPSYIAVDGAGNLYIMDAYNSAVRKVSSGVITTVAGSPMWEGDYGNAGPATDAVLNFDNGCLGGDLPCPWLNGGIAVDSAGTIYFSDFSNYRVRKVQNGIITTVAGNGADGFGFGDGGPATGAQFFMPQTVAVDGAGTLYVGDPRLNVIRKISQGIITTAAGTGLFGFAGDGGPATDAQLGLCPNDQYPTLCDAGVAVNTAGELLIADINNARIRKVDRSGIITTVAGNGATGSSGDGGTAMQAQFDVASNVAAGPDGTFYVQDSSTRIRQVGLDGTIRTVAGNGTVGWTGDGGPATSAQIDATGIGLDPSGRLYIADWTNRVRKVDTNGIITTPAGTGAPNFAGDNGPAVNAAFWIPRAVAADSAGNVFIADDGNGRVRRVDPAGIITTIAGGTGFGVADGPAVQAGLSNPTGLALDAIGNIYVADSQNYVVRVLVPQDDSCAYSLDRNSLAVPAEGGNVSLTMQTTAACSWFISYLPHWMTGTLTGRGPATVNLLAAPNQGAARSETFSVGGVPVTVTQEGAACAFSIDSYTASFSITGGTGTVNVTAANGCAWTASSTADWVTVTGPSAGAGNGSVQYAVAANSGGGRSGILTIAGKTFTVQQGTSLLPGCQYYISLETTASFAAPRDGGIVTISLDTMAACPWIIWPVPDWITTVAGGKGPAQIQVSVAPNTGPQRVATLIISQATYMSGAAATITQDPVDCDVARLLPNAQTFIAGGGPGYVTATVCLGTNWVASTTADWILIDNPTTGLSGSAVSYTVAPNTGAARTGTIMISGTQLIVQQLSASEPHGRFVPVTPCRVADTRGAAGPFGGPGMAADSTRSFTVPQSACGLPPTALAYSMNVTVVPRSGGLQYLTIWPTGKDRPFVSTLNSWNGRVVANAAIVPAGDQGAVSVFVTDDTDVILDVNGYFDSSPAADSYGFETLDPCRVADTRNPPGMLAGPAMAGGESRDFPVLSSSCNVAPSAVAYSMNVTAVPPGPLYYLSMWPAGGPRPNVSTLNSWTGEVTANAAIVPAGANGAVSVFTSDPSEVVLDINGYFARNGNRNLAFYPVTPCRVVDTRLPDGKDGGPIMEAGSARAFPFDTSGCFVPAEASAYAVNITVVPDGPLSYLTAWSGPYNWTPPTVSTLNSWDGSVVANAAIVSTGNWGQGISVFVTDRADVIIDVSGYFLP